MFKDNTFVWSLPTLAIFFAGLDYINGGALFSTLSLFLSQNGF